MEDKTSTIETLIESIADYGKTSYNLIKLKALDKATNVVSSLLSHTFVIVIVSSFMLFLNFGLAFWLGEILGKMYYGFFVIAAFYGLTAVLLRFVLQKWVKRLFGNYFIKQVLK